MNAPANWQTPITAAPGQSQTNVNPLHLLPGRPDLSRLRLDIQQPLIDAGTDRATPIAVTPDGVIWDGHHAVRAAAESGLTVNVKVVNQTAKATAASVLDLPVG